MLEIQGSVGQSEASRSGVIILRRDTVYQILAIGSATARTSRREPARRRQNLGSAEYWWKPIEYRHGRCEAGAAPPGTARVIIAAEFHAPTITAEGNCWIAAAGLLCGSVCNSTSSFPGNCGAWSLSPNIATSYSSFDSRFSGSSWRYACRPRRNVASISIILVSRHRE